MPDLLPGHSRLRLGLRLLQCVSLLPGLNGLPPGFPAVAARRLAGFRDHGGEMCPLIGGSAASRTPVKDPIRFQSSRLVGDPPQPAMALPRRR
jgi:hypothetical protein